MLHGKIQSTIEIIEDVVDNRQKENDNANTAKRNSIFFDSFAKLSPSIASYVLARKNFNFALQSNTVAILQDLMDYSRTTFDNAKAVNPTLFKQKSEALIDSIANEWETFYKTANNDLINGLNIIVLVHPTPNAVRACITAFNKCEKWPLTQETIISYKEAKEKADKFLEEMRFDEEIKEFLIKVRDKKATLADISPSILEWIKSENISEKISLNIRNTV